MGHKNKFDLAFNWQSANPATGFLPLTNITQDRGSKASGVVNGVMTGTNVIYSQIIDVSKMDNIGLEVAWTGSAVGVFEVMGSISGINFPSLTFDPVLAQPSGTAGEYLVGITQDQFRYIMLKYTNTSGTGTLNVYGQFKDLN